ncbi:MAG: hypothetical protein IGS54_08285 [Elainella sp. C42_A2020_010]|nr:hypothetical protein [Elainella sp. C42_A2020_010]
MQRLNGRLNRWLHQQQQRALEEAYQGATAIKALENQYFQGTKIAYRPGLSKTVYEYVRSSRDRQLLRVRTSLAQFRVGNFLLNPKAVIQAGDGTLEVTPNSPEAEIFAKLDFIDSVIGKYREPDGDLDVAMAVAEMEESTSAKPKGETEAKKISGPHTTDIPTLTANHQRWSGAIRETLNQIGQEINPDEQQVIQELRLRRAQNRVALRWLLILLLVPLLVHLVTKVAILNPVLGNYSNRHPTQIELSEEIRQHFLSEFVEFKESLEVQEVLGKTLTEAEKAEKLHEMAVELWRESRNQALNGLKNVVADFVALVVFGGLVYFNRNKLLTLRSVTNRTFLGLSDPIKVFMFILVTDLFVGFHSAEGWEVILEGAARHFGLPESKFLINGFIATVPVMIDAVIKFWIFSYLTRYSPSASAIYERMNT